MPWCGEALPVVSVVLFGKCFLESYQLPVLTFSVVQVQALREMGVESVSVIFPFQWNLPQTFRISPTSVLHSWLLKREGNRLLAGIIRMFKQTQRK